MRIKRVLHVDMLYTIKFGARKSAFIVKTIKFKQVTWDQQPTCVSLKNLFNEKKSCLKWHY